jgi:hypothetical protein
MLVRQGLCHLSHSTRNYAALCVILKTSKAKFDDRPVINNTWYDDIFSSLESLT